MFNNNNNNNNNNNYYHHLDDRRTFAPRILPPCGGRAWPSLSIAGSTLSQTSRPKTYSANTFHGGPPTEETFTRGAHIFEILQKPC